MEADQLIDEDIQRALEILMGNEELENADEIFRRFAEFVKWDIEHELKKV